MKNRTPPIALSQSPMPKRARARGPRHPSRLLSCPAAEPKATTDQGVEPELLGRPCRSLPSAAVPTALLSVYDKAGIVDLGRGLHELGWRLVSSGGTARALADAGLPVTDVAELTGSPAILGHRVVTLHPKVHGGILADLDDPEHRQDLEAHGIEPIALVVVNLYPFADDPGVELIDIGGPAMVRAAAKNHAHVGVVVDPAEYEPVLDELRTEGGCQPARAPDSPARRSLAHRRTTPRSSPGSTGRRPPVERCSCRDSLTLRLDRVQDLRYGENPHQLAARYRERGRTGWWDSAQQHGGKELSYLNLYDAEAAWRLVHRFAEPACVIVKHANPCGVAVAGDITTAYERANACDPVERLRGHRGREPSTAPVGGRRPGAGVHRGRRGARLRGRGTRHARRQGEPPRAHGGCARRADARRAGRSTAACSCRHPIPWRSIATPGGWSSSTEPTPAQWDDLQFAWTVCAAVSSNAIVFARDRQAFGIGAGQQNRLDSARIAADRGRRSSCRRCLRQRRLLPVPRRASTPWRQPASPP